MVVLEAASQCTSDHKSVLVILVLAVLLIVILVFLVFLRLFIFWVLLLLFLELGIICLVGVYLDFEASWLILHGLRDVVVSLFFLH